MSQLLQKIIGGTLGAREISQKISHPGCFSLLHVITVRFRTSHPLPSPSLCIYRLPSTQIKEKDKVAPVLLQWQKQTGQLITSWQQPPLHRPPLLETGKCPEDSWALLFRSYCVSKLSCLSQKPRPAFHFPGIPTTHLLFLHEARQ